jgi:hypothetical protein
LYDLRFWEVRRIIRGYRRRDKLKHQLMAECVYAAIHVMRDPKGKTVADMFPMLFDDDDDDFGAPADAETVAMLQAEMTAMNAERPAVEAAGTVANENNSE